LINPSLKKEKKKKIPKRWRDSYYYFLKICKEREKYVKYPEKRKRAARKWQEYPPDLGVCWMCWLEITKLPFEPFRDSEFCSDEKHDEECPLCGYTHWSGKVWYPFKYLWVKEIGNPSKKDS